MPEFKVGDFVKLIAKQPDEGRWVDNNYNYFARHIMNDQVCEVLSVYPHFTYGSLQVWVPTINRIVTLYSYLFKYYNEP